MSIHTRALSYALLRLFRGSNPASIEINGRTPNDTREEEDPINKLQADGSVRVIVITQMDI